MKRLSDLPAGTKVKDPNTIYYGKPIEWVIGEHGYYTSTSTVLVSNYMLEAFVYDATEKTITLTGEVGSSEYKTSNIDQWLNSDKAAGQWFVPQHDEDTPPDYADFNGFLYSFSNEFKNNLLDTEIPCRDKVSELTVKETITRKVFLPCVMEVNKQWAGSNNTSALDYFYNNEASTTYLPGCATSAGITSKYYWLRTEISNEYKAFAIKNHSIIDSADHVNKSRLGIRPLINLSSDTKVLDEPDANGVYTLKFNSPPTVSGVNTDLGGKTNVPFEIVYSVDDEDVDQTLRVEEYLNDTLFNSYDNAVRGQNYVCSITSEMLNNLELESNNKITILVYDGEAITTREYTFIKRQHKLEFTLSEILDSSVMPTRTIVNIEAIVPEGATLNIYACNNAYDENPTWEDVTEVANSKVAYQFTNTTKTADKWGVTYKVVGDRGIAETRLQVFAVGGAI